MLPCGTIGRRAKARWIARLKVLAVRRRVAAPCVPGFAGEAFSSHAQREIARVRARHFSS
jgi:hypothetical protein